MLHENTLDAVRAALVVVDIQEAFRDPVADFNDVALNAAILIQAAQMLEIPVIVTEQYPQGLGATAFEIRAVLPDEFEPIEKTQFSACGAASFVSQLESANRQQTILCGLEAHVCINQTAHDLLARGLQVHLITDAITSRATHNKQIAIEKMQRSGAIISSVEMTLFELLRDSRHEHFKEIQRLIK